jgi:hypothetical protein
MGKKTLPQNNAVDWAFGDKEKALTKKSTPAENKKVLLIFV